MSNKPLKNPDKLRPLTRKQQAFVRELVNNPKMSATKIAEKTYNTLSYSAARAIASENLTKPNIRTELAKYSDRVEQVLFNTIDQWGEHDKPRQREIAIDTAKFVHDKIHGRATQRIEQSTQGVTLNIDLTSTLNPDEEPTDTTT